MLNSTRIPLDGGRIDLDRTDGGVEMTVRIGDRTVFGIALTVSEAEALGMGLARPDGPTVADLFAVADSMGRNASDMIAPREDSPAYLSAAVDEWEAVRHDSTATPAQILAAEDTLRDARADALTEDFPHDLEHLDVPENTRF